MSSLQTSLAIVDRESNKDLQSLQRIFRKRRSIRSYLSEKPKREDIFEILDSARFAPNSCNLQHCGFIYIDDDVILKKLEKIATKKVSWAPALIVIIDDKRFSQTRRAGLQSVAAATENVILTATAKGLGTCWMAGFVGDIGIRGVLKIPNYYEITGLMTIGYPNPNTQMVPTQKLESKDYIHLNRFETKEVELLSDLNVDNWHMSKLTSYRERIGSVYAPRKRIQLYHVNMIKDCANIYINLQQEYKKKLNENSITAIDIASYDGCFIREFYKRKSDLDNKLRLFVSDYSQYFLDLIKEQCIDVETVLMDVDHTFKIESTTATKCYDFLSLVFKIEFLPDIERLLKTLRLFTKDDGYLFLASVPKFTPRVMFYKAETFMNYANMYERNRYYRFGPNRHLSTSSIKASIKNAGWMIEKSGKGGCWPKTNFKWFWLSPSK